jgi:prefoldin alpha subunit
MAKKKRQVEVSEQQLMETYKQEQSRLNSLKQAIREIRQNISEVLTTKDTLKEMQKTKAGEKIMVAVGTGVYISGSIDNTTDVHFTIGGNVVKKKSVQDALETLENMRGAGEKQLATFQQEATKLNSDVEELSRLLIHAQRMKQTKPTF